MKRFLVLTVALIMLIFTCANAQLIGEGDTLWYKGGFPEIKQVLFTPDGTKLGVLGAVDVGVFTMFDALNGNELWTFKLATHYFKQFAYSNDGSKVFILPPSYAKINVLDVNTGLVLDALPVLKGENILYEYNQVYQTKNPNILLLANGTECFALYDIAERKIIKERVGNLINKIFACPYSDYFINAYQYESSNKWKTKIEMYDINTLDFVATLGEEEALVQSGVAKITYDGKYAATNFGGRALQIWDLENKKLFKEFTPTIPTDSTSGRGGGPGLAFCYNNEMIINCGGRYAGVTTIATTLTNFMNDKRALIYPDNGFSTIDINKSDTKLAGGVGYDIVVLKLKNDAVPVKDVPINNEETLYPNPSSGNITVNIPENFGLIITGQIFDNSGKIIKIFLPNELPQTDSKLILNLSNLTNGVYLLKLTNTSNILSYKIILEK